MPVSLTAITACLPARRKATSTRPPSRLYLMALVSRLLKMISISRASAEITSGPSAVEFDA